MRELLEAGVDIDSGGENDMTALMNAAAYDRSGRGVKFLLVEGADPRRTDDGGFTAVEFAVIERNIVAVEILLEFEPDLPEDIGEDLCELVGISRVSTEEEKRELRELLC